MSALKRFLDVLEEIAPHLPAKHPLQCLEVARKRSSKPRTNIAPQSNFSERSIQLARSKMATGSLIKVVGTSKKPAPDPRRIRFRLAQLLLGALTEERFAKEKEALTAGRLTVEDHRLGRTDTDYRVLNGGGRPIFRINIKFHGTAFDKAQEYVELAPDDCFALATYKIHQALVRQRAEALPYVFLVLSCLGLTSESVSNIVPDRFGWFLSMATTFPKLDVEEAMVASLLTESNASQLSEVRRRIAESEFRVLSAARAEHLLKEKFFERVFALRQRAFTRTFRNAELNMHFSLRQEMTPVRDFLAAVALESPQRLTVLLDRGELA
ncbi:MAG: hypothetical protein ACREC3_17185 [Methyloceanibacter sp.]